MNKKNYHFVCMIVISIGAFFCAFACLASGVLSVKNTNMAAFGGLFSMLGMFSAITASAVRSINRRLDMAGIPLDPEFGHPNTIGQSVEAEQVMDANLPFAPQPPSNATH